MKLHIVIRCDNAAFGEDDYKRGEEICATLRRFIESIERNTGIGKDDAPLLFDSNGNSVGRAQIKED